VVEKNNLENLFNLVEIVVQTKYSKIKLYLCKNY